MKKVDKGLKMPLYIQLANIIQEMIDIGDLVAGECLMPEREICTLQEVSRMTVNKAIEKLVRQGLVIRHQGKGTFIARKRPTSRYENLAGFSEMMTKSGFAVSNTILSFEKIDLSSRIQRKLATDSKKGYKIERIRYVENEPLILESIYLTREMCPDLTKELVEDHSIYQLYTKRYQHQLVRAEQTIHPILLNEAQAVQLEQKKGDLALNVWCRVYTEKEEVMAYTESIFLTEKHDFEVVLT